MPVFINEVVIRGNVERPQSQGPTSAATSAAGPIDVDVLAAEVMQAVLDMLERQRDRVGER